MKFEWNKAKDARTMQERGFGFDDASRIFSGRVVTWEDDRRDYGEQRFRPSVRRKAISCMWFSRGAAT